MSMADLVAGTFAGFGICGVGHPFDTLKVLMQTQPEKYKTMKSAFRETVDKYGFGGLYRGVGAPLVGMGILNAIQFATFARAKAFFTNDGKDDSLNNVAIAAAVTGVVIAFVEGPQDFLKCQMQVTSSAPSSIPRPTTIPQLIPRIMAERGPLGIFQGFSATIFRNAVGVSAYFYVYEGVRRFLAGDQPVSSLSPLSVLMAGGLGGVAYWIPSYPFDVVKSAIQSDTYVRGEQKYRGTTHAFKSLWSQGGIGRFTVGFAPCLARAFPANAVGFFLYEAVLDFMSLTNNQALLE